MDPERATRLDNLIAQRSQTYGPMEQTALATGRAIRAVLEAHFQIELPGDLPPHIVELIMVQIKVVRCALPFKANPDNYDDGHNYLKMAEALDPRYHTTAQEPSTIKG